MYKVNINYGPKIDFTHCVGCGECYDMCPLDVFGWDEAKKMPTVAYPGECAMCCFCEIVCPEVAIDVHMPVHQLLDFGILPTSLSHKSKFLED